MLHSGTLVSQNQHDRMMMIQLMTSSSHQNDFVANDQQAWSRVLKDARSPDYFMKAKTPTSAFSYGAMVYIALRKDEDNVSVLVGSASNQVNEKEKLASYIDAFSKTLEKQAGKFGEGFPQRFLPAESEAIEAIRNLPELREPTAQ
jgi:hypothetical protein